MFISVYVFILLIVLLSPNHFTVTNYVSYVIGATIANVCSWLSNSMLLFKFPLYKFYFYYIILSLFLINNHVQTVKKKNVPLYISIVVDSQG